MQVVPKRVTNLTQIFRDTWALSGTAAATKVISSENPVAKNQTDGGYYHAMAMEKAFLFGQRYMGTRNGQPFHLMDGLVQMIGNPDFYPKYAPRPNISHLAPPRPGRSWKPCLTAPRIRPLRKAVPMSA